MKSRVLLLVTLLGVACSDGAPNPDTLQLPPLAAGNVRFNIVVEQVSESVMSVRLLLDAPALDLGAYQGRFTFDASALSLLDATMPQDNYRVVNTNNALAGEVRFAGFAVQAFESPVAVELRFAINGFFDPDQLHAELEVAGDVLGTPVGRDRIAPPTLMIVR